jgi:hypothetical protein
VSHPLPIEVIDLAKTQIRVADEWWRLNRAEGAERDPRRT